MCRITVKSPQVVDGLHRLLVPIGPAINSSKWILQVEAISVCAINFNLLPQSIAHLDTCVWISFFFLERRPPLNVSPLGTFIKFSSVLRVLGPPRYLLVYISLLAVATP